jgi:Xaa-Pro aminopeptidase
MMTAPNRGFIEEEFAARTLAAQAKMANANMAGLLLTTEPEVRYFSGFHTLFWQSPTRPWFLFVPSTGKPVAIIPEIGADLMRRTWIDDIRTWSAPAPEDDGISLLTEFLSPIAKRGETIGLMKGHETHLRMPLGDYERLMAGLSGLRIADATGLVRDLRMVKSEAEIEKVAHICAIGSRSFARVPEIAHEGQPLEDLFRAFRREGLAQGADDVPYLVGGADTGGYSDVISPPSRRALARGDILMLDTGANWDGYYCDFNRNWAIGRADDASRRAYDVLWRATEAGIAAARPGATCRDLFLAMQGVIAEIDDQGGDVGRLGHGLGMQLTEWPSHAAWDTTEIRKKMVLTLDPSLTYGNGRIMVHEEDIVVRDTSAELLTERAAPELPIIEYLT